ncbi:type VI secretion system baseplate subunit TssF [Vibrio sp. S4M6]|uniref:type VI secretion system baseplate subunit TssF n=1 Tax=Vibrio sinus TaxID=2946865 RepID=UPI00202A195E|nr:type VI secretion system baseplate subunit TssF [Vibrio sinus]MCL9783154.1 type VI secretion system baseplate subunit TssF [Vibrio sinus]
MTDPLLRYYEQELAFVRRSLGQFGQEYPSHAESLNIHQGTIEDPNMARLLDGVALLNATVVKQLSDQLPEVINGLLGVLYPSYIQTVPSVAYLQLHTEDEPIETATLPSGSQFIGTVNETECTFSTVDELHIAPYFITHISALSAPFNFNRPKEADQSSAVIQISLSTGDPEILFRHLDIGDLDIFVQGFENNADSLVELMLSNTTCISISDIECVNHITVDSQRMKNRISDMSFKFLPEHGNQFSGYQLLSEFFFFKEKRQFFRLKGFKDYCTALDTSEVVVNLFMSSLPSEFMRLFNKNVFKLNVVPAINLFEHTGEPVTYDQRQLSIPINADSHSDNYIEVVEVLDVYEITPTGEKILTPVFREKYHADKLRDSWQSKKDSNGEFCVSITLNKQTGTEFNKLYGTRLLCTNGKQACAVDGVLECQESIDLPGEFSTIYPPSAPIEKERDQNVHWQFIGLMNCNFSSLLQAENATDTLKQMLSLCSREQVPSSEIQMIRTVTFKSQVSAIRILGQNVFSPGTEIEITLDTSGPYLSFSDVLNRFFQQFCSFDRYVQLKIRIYGRDGIAREYPKIHGSQQSL